MANYNKYYGEKEEYFGNPYPELIEFFDKLSARGRLVDLGAGQGRNSIPLFKMGYDVTAVDTSSVGLKQIKDQYEGIKTFTQNIYDFDISQFDYILMDSMLHFYKREHDKEIALVKHIFESMKSGAVFVNCMIFKNCFVINELLTSFNPKKILLEKEIQYELYGKTKYHITAIMKL